jgi:hypothetical protein
MTNAERIKAIEERLAAATPGPFDVHRYEHGGGRIIKRWPDRQTPDLIADLYVEADREFYIAAPDDLRWLCVEVRRLVKALHEAIRDGDGQCFYCDAATIRDHRGDCPLAGYEPDEENDVSDAEAQYAEIARLRGPVCDKSGCYAEHGACPEHGGDACLITTHGLITEIDRLRSALREVWAHHEGLTVPQEHGRLAALVEELAPKEKP